MASKWGNPELKSFRSNFIRRVMVDDGRVFVHKVIMDEAEEVLIRAADSGATFSTERWAADLPSYGFDDSFECKMGLKFQIPNFDKTIAVEDLGFTQIGDVFIYTDFVAEEKKPKVELPTYQDEIEDKIGSRQLTRGARGNDVKFLAYFFGMENPSQIETMTLELISNLQTYQARMGIPVTGDADWNTWKAILPKGSERLSAGTAGAKVRALQAALVVNGYNPPTTARFGIETIRAVREFQNANNFRVTGRAGFLEWNLLFALK